MHLWLLFPWVGAWAGFGIGFGNVAGYTGDGVPFTHCNWKGEVRQAECEAMSAAFFRELNQIRNGKGLKRLRDFLFIAVSTLYDAGSGTYYSAVNLR